jgi:hypothetical protein
MGVGAATSPELFEKSLAAFTLVALALVAAFLVVDLVVAEVFLVVDFFAFAAAAATTAFAVVGGVVIMFWADSVGVYVHCQSPIVLRAHA